MSDRSPAAPGLGPAVLVAAALFVLLGTWFWAIGALSPEEVPDYADSPRQITGMALMLTLIPTYLVVGSRVGQRRSLALVEQLRPRLPDRRVADEAREAIRGSLGRVWLPGIGVGVLLGLMNTQPLEALQSEVPVLHGGISLGQIVMWVLIGVLLGTRLVAARAFRRIAEVVPLDPFRPEPLRPLARSGMVDVALIAGAILFTPLQSLDAQFRWYNYHFGFLVALPAASFALLWPLQPLHRRNRDERDRRLAEVERQLDALGSEPPTTAEASTRLESLLAHRERLRGVRTWPLSTGLLSRVFLYLVIPPLAWAGAALVERAVDALLAP